MSSLEARIKQRAHELGFELVGIARAGPADSFDHFRAWLDEGLAGEMDYMHRHAEARRHPSSILPEVRSVIMVGMNYKPLADSEPECAGSPRPGTPGRGVGGEGIALRSFVPLTPSPSPPSTGERGKSIGRIARYARGQDYHDVLRERLNQLLAWLQEIVPGCRGRGVVDTAPLLERDFARRAGLGWFGKNTMLLNQQLGSYFFLGALLVDLELTPDASQETDHCGTCTACLDACPTQAFPEPGTLDARRCISYLTIEHKGSIPAELRAPMGDWVFGCDVCQEVCPWNHKAPPGKEPALMARRDLETVDAADLLELSPEEFRRRFHGTALTRSKRRGLLRNAAIVLGNHGGAKALPGLRRALNDPEPLVREAAEWAINRILSQGGRAEPMETIGHNVLTGELPFSDQ